MKRVFIFAIDYCEGRIKPDNTARIIGAALFAVNLKGYPTHLDIYNEND
jgi:hypothetical protein